MKKQELKVGSKVVFARPVGYHRVDDQLIQRPNPGCNGIRNQAYHGTIKADNTVYTVSEIRGREFDLTAEEDIRKDCKTITMRWCHQLDWAPELPKQEKTIEVVALKPAARTSLAQKASQLSASFSSSPAVEEESLDALFDEMESLEVAMAQYATLKIQHTRVQAKIATTLNKRLSGSKLKVYESAN